METKTKKIVALFAIMGILLTNSAYAEKIGTGSIVGPGTTFDINWDGIFGGTENASGSISGIKITALVAPRLDMTVSTGAIDLGDITTNQTGSLTVTLSTNSPTGLTLNATSQEGGLRYTSGATLVNSNSGGAYQYNATEITTTSRSKELYTSSSTELSTPVTFTVSARAQGNAPAGKYEDYVTFTVIANF